MTEESEFVDVSTHAQQARERVRANGRLQDISHGPQVSDAPYPYLEDAVTAARKYPYTALSLIVSIVGIVVGALVIVSVTIIGSVFSMSNTMHEIKVQQETIVAKLQVNENEMKVLRTYSATVLARQDFMVGLLSPSQQRAVAVYDQSRKEHKPVQGVPNAP